MRKRVFKTFAAAALATTIAGTTIIGSTAFADEISTLTQQKQDKQNELDQLQQQAAYLLTEMSSLEQDMADLSDEIDQTNADLEAAQQLQQKQFDDTKLRIKYMYEDQSTSISDVFLTASDMSDVINKASYMQQLISDRTKEEEVIEGMQESRFQFRHTHTHSHSADDHSDDHADEHSDDHTADDHADEYTAGDHSEDNHADDHSLEAGHSHTDEDIEYDEHIWLSLKNAAVLTQYLADIVKDLDKDNSQLYQDNADAYINQLAGLDSDYENVCENSRLKTVIFGDRFPFRYLVDDYGIDYYAAFAGCSAETEASFKTVTFLSGKIDEIGTGSILVIDGSDKRIANTIKGNTSQKNQQILTMDSMQSAGTDDADYTYLNVMSNNLVVLKQALQ